MFSPSVVSVSLELLDAAGGCLAALEPRTLRTRMEHSAGSIESENRLRACSFSPQNCVPLIPAVEQVVADGQLGTHSSPLVQNRGVTRLNPATLRSSPPSQTQTSAHSFNLNMPVPLFFFFLSFRLRRACLSRCSCECKTHTHTQALGQDSLGNEWHID